MGEYVKLQGEYDTRKIGTCESLFYVRFADLRTWVREGRAERAPGSCEPSAYLDPANGYRFRFPFPDEDGIPGPLMDFDRGFDIPAPLEMVAALDHGKAHALIAYRGQPKRNTARQRLVVACPQAHADNNGPGELQIVAQRPMPDGLLWAVVRCPYCGDMWRIDHEQARRLAEYNAEATSPETVEVVARILAGYAPDAIWATETGARSE